MFATDMDIKSLFSDPYSYIFIGLFVVIIIQLFYYFFFFSKIAFYKSKPRNRKQTYPVSVIICAKNEAENLTRYLPGALLQDYQTTYEVITVNDISDDDTKYILQEYRKTFKNLQQLDLQQKAQFIPGKKYALSMGIRAAKYEVLLLTDADCLPATNKWIETMQDHYTEGIDIVIGYSPFEKKKGLLNKLVRWEGFHTAIQYLSYAQNGIPYMGVGRNLSYKKELFLRSKGFSSINQVPGGDDDLFINKVATDTNVAISIDPASFTITRPPATWRQWKNQKRRHYSTSKYYKPLHKFLLGLYALSNFLFYPLLVLSFLFFAWEIVLAAYVLKTVAQYIITYRCASKLHEQDLALWTPLLDVWMFFYYVIFAFAPFRRPDEHWK